MRYIPKMKTVFAACVAITAGSSFALAGERASTLKASQVDLTKLATLANVPAEMWIAPASSGTLDDVDAVEIDWTASSRTSFSTFRRAKIDPGEHRTIEYKR